MSRWSTADLARVSAKLGNSIASPLTIPLTGKIIPRRNKYGNERVALEGYTFDSQLEARRYQELKLLLAGGQIQNLEVHKKIYLHTSGVQIGYYCADFAYVENGQMQLEDCKGVLTTLYCWKKRHVKAQYNIDIREIKA